MITGNFLELCQLTLAKAQFSGTGPGSVLNQTGEAKQVVESVQAAWLAIQDEENHWAFLSDEQQSLTVIGRKNYMPADLNAPELKGIDKLFCEQTPLTYLSPAEFKDRFRFGTEQGQPRYVTQDLIGGISKIVLYPIPDKAYNLHLEYKKKPQFFINNEDIPNIDLRHRWAIVYLAALDLAQQQEDGGLHQQMTQKYAEALQNMHSQYLPTWDFAHL